MLLLTGLNTNTTNTDNDHSFSVGGRCGRDRMVVGLTTTKKMYLCNQCLSLKLSVRGRSVHSVLYTTYVCQ